MPRVRQAIRGAGDGWGAPVKADRLEALIKAACQAWDSDGTPASAYRYFDLLMRKRTLYGQRASGPGRTALRRSRAQARAGRGTVLTIGGVPYFHPVEIRYSAAAPVVFQAPVPGTNCGLFFDSPAPSGGLPLTAENLDDLIERDPIGQAVQQAIARRRP